jgi:hypothetical protein
LLAAEIGAALQIESDKLGLSFRLQIPQDFVAAAG